MIKIFKKSLIFIISGSATLILTACYGAMMQCEKMVSQNLKIVDSDGKPIPGLEVSHPNDVTFTDENGNIIYDFCSEDKGASREIIIKDVDGDENGNFIDKSVSIELSSEDQTIIMDEK